MANYATLANAKTAYAKAVEEAKVASDKAEAAKVDALIAQIGLATATDVSKAKIDAAEQAYLKLTAVQKTYVTTYSTLTAAKVAYSKAAEIKKITETKFDATKIEAGKIPANKIEAGKIEAKKLAPATK